MRNMTESDAVRHTSNQWDSTRALLAASPAPAGREAEWSRALEFLDIADRNGAHLVASVVAVDADGFVLLARHRRYPRWGPLGGHLELDDASLCAAATRELLEEASLVAQVHTAPIDVRLTSYRCRTVTDPVHHLDVQFVAIVTSSAPALVPNNELTGLEWFGDRDRQSLPPAAAELVDFARALATPRR
jgi:8-oxo-dGTP pyrophosphatase MutT (NUDIX family)